MRKLRIKKRGTHCVVYNHKDERLGYILYENKWKKWVWSQEKDIIMSAGCLKQIIKELERDEE